MAVHLKKQDVSLFSIAIPVVAIMGFSAGIAGQLGYFQETTSTRTSELAQTVSIPAGTVKYRADGEFYKNGFAVDGPMVGTRAAIPLTVMKYQVSEGEYARCVKDGKCAAIPPTHVHGKNYPATGVSYDDAMAYA